MVKIEISGDTPIEVAVLVTILAREVERDVDVRELAEEINRMQARELRKKGLSRYDGLTVEVTNRGKGEESR